MSRSLVEARRALTQMLNAAGLDNAAGEARLLVAHVTGLDAAQQAAAPEFDLDADQMALLLDCGVRRACGEPLQHILGYADFWTLRLKSDARALVPRSDTETLVALALEMTAADAPLRILDLGTGTGAILLAVLSERPLARGWGVDLSADALALAEENAAAVGLSDRVVLMSGSWDTALPYAPFDLVVSNPPYIRSADMKGLDADVLRDPHLALDGGADGMDAYRAIIALAPRLLAPGGTLALEIGWDQADEVTALAADCDALRFAGLRRDLEERPRALAFRLAGTS